MIEPRSLDVMPECLDYSRPLVSRPSESLTVGCVIWLVSLFFLALMLVVDVVTGLWQWLGVEIIILWSDGTVWAGVLPGPSTAV